MLRTHNWTSLLFLWLAVFPAASVEARSLSDLLAPTSAGLGRVVAAPFVLELERTISRGTDFPATATTPGFTYRYNPELLIYERSAGSLGPAFLERADTVGQGHFDVGASYLHADFTERDGHSLDGLSEPVLFSGIGTLSPAQLTFDKFDLETSAVYLSSSYGITNRIDVNLLIPFFHTSLRARQTLAPVGSQPATVSVNESATGIGDIQLRGKYRFWEDGGLKAATGLALRLPSGDEEDFQSVGGVTLTPSVVLSYATHGHDFHTSFGVEVDPEDLDRSRGNYGAGVSLRLLDWLTGNIDIIGSSQFSDDESSETIPFSSSQIQVGQFGNFRIEPAGSNTKIITTIDRTDVVDLAVGLKVNVYKTAVLFGSAIVPLTQDGVRADVIPVAGVEVSF